MHFAFSFLTFLTLFFPSQLALLGSIGKWVASIP